MMTNRYIAIIIIALLLLILAFFRWISVPYVAGYFISVNLVTYLVMLYDKAQAYKHKWRIPHSYMKILVFIGGALAAIIAMFQLRHKSLKEEFFYACLAALLIHAVMFVCYLIYF
jgi:uncharacterized membrane protein YsdA (DUF1294 family)